jgi:VanZ family protein
MIPSARRPGRIAMAAVLVLAHMTLIFVLSSRRPPEAVVSIGIPDWVLHLGEYGVLGLLLAHLAFSVTGGTAVRALVPLPALIGTLYGLSDEWHQAFVPGRDPSAADFAMDAVGSLLGAVAFWLAVRARPA